jgi:hypothetical protein
LADGFATFFACLALYFLIKAFWPNARRLANFALFCG